MPRLGRSTASNLRHRLYEILEHGPIGDRVGRLTGRFIVALILVPARTLLARPSSSRTATAIAAQGGWSILRDRRARACDGVAYAFEQGIAQQRLFDDRNAGSGGALLQKDGRMARDQDCGSRDMPLSQRGDEVQAAHSRKLLIDDEAGECRKVRLIEELGARGIG